MSAIAETAAWEPLDATAAAAAVVHGSQPTLGRLRSRVQSPSELAEVGALADCGYLAEGSANARLAGVTDTELPEERAGAELSEQTGAELTAGLSHAKLAGARCPT